MAPTPAEQQAPRAAGRPAQRYGEQPRSRRGVLVAALVTAAVVVAGLGWVAWGMLQPAAEGEVGTYEVVDATRVDYVLEATRPVGTTAVCTVEAIGAGYGQVGIVDVTVPPSDTLVTRQRLSMATSERASAVAVRACRLL